MEWSTGPGAHTRSQLVMFNMIIVAKSVLCIRGICELYHDSCQFTARDGTGTEYEHVRPTSLPFSQVPDDVLHHKRRLLAHEPRKESVTAQMAQRDCTPED